MFKHFIQFTSVRYKMLLTIFLIFVIPVSTILSVTHGLLIRDRENSIMQNYQNSLKASGDALENLHEELYTMVYRLSQTMWFKSIIHAQEDSNLYMGDDVYDLHMYNDQLATYTMINDQFSNIIMYFPGRSYIMSSMGLLYQTQLPERLFKVISMSSDEWGAYLTSREGTGFSAIQRISENGVLSDGVLFKFAFPMESSLPPRANMIVYIRQDNIVALLDDQLKNGSSHLVIRTGDKVLYAQDDAATTCSYDIAYSGDYVTIECTLDPRVFNTSDLWIILGIAQLLCLTLGLGLAWTVSRYFYRPLTVLMHKFNKDQELAKGIRAEEYKVIENQLTNIVHQEEELRLRLNLQRPILLNAIFDMMLHDRYVPDEEFDKLLELLKVTFVHSHFCVVKLAFAEDIHSSVVEALVKKARSDSIDIYYAWQKKHISLILNYDDESICFNATADMLKRLEHEHGEFVCGMGSGGDDLYSVTRSGKQADIALKAAYLYDPHAIVKWNAHCTEKRAPSGLTHDIDQISALISTGQVELATEKTEQMICGWRRSKALPAEVIQVLMDFYNSLVQCNTYFNDSLDLESYRPRLISIHYDAARIVELVSRMAQLTFEHVEHLKHDYVRKLVAFVDDNLYNPDLSLTLLADAFGYSSSYISKLFKDTFECNFLDYVMKRRIERAKERLVNTDCSISDIAHDVGFTSDISFRRQFKSYTGMAPSTYRAMHSLSGSKE